MSPIDEPVLGTRHLSDEDADAALPGRIRTLVEEQLYGVLCTQGSEQPYGSLVAFAFSTDLTAAAFATPVTTRKYQLLSECDRVSLVVDNRPKFGVDMTRIEAVTVTGRALRLEPGERFERWSKRLLERHPYLEAFLAARSTALFRIEVARFFHVERFQEVRQWIPAPGG